jgi:hypothetical protein
MARLLNSDVGSSSHYTTILSYKTLQRHCLSMIRKWCMGMFILTQFLFLMASSKIFRGVIIYSTKKELDSFTVHIFFFLLFFLHSYLSIFFLCETPATSLCLCVNSEGATPLFLSFFSIFFKIFYEF